MTNTIKSAMIGIIALALTLSCFEVQAGSRTIQTNDFGQTQVTLASGDVVWLRRGESLQIDKPAISLDFVDMFDYMTRESRVPEKHDPRLRVSIREGYALLLRLAMLCSLVVFALRRRKEIPVVFSRGTGRKVALVDLRYPYAKMKVYMSGSLFTTAAQFWHAGWDVEIIDFNIDARSSSRVRAVFDQAGVIGVSVVGAPYLKQLVKFCKGMKQSQPDKRVLLGGQVMTAFSPEQFAKLFEGTNAVLIKDQTDLRQVDIPPESLSDPLDVSLQPILERLPEDVLRLYLSHEMPLVLSQNCQFNCHFCAASKNKPEKFKDIVEFSADLAYMVRKAAEFGLDKLEFYATSLDFFQTPSELAKYLRVIAQVRNRGGVDIRVRALACMSSFLLADKRLGNLGELLTDSGFHCVGFGVDGPTQEIWDGEGKTQNHESDIPKVLRRTKEIGLVTEILMIMGDQRYDWRLLAKTVHVCYGYIIDWSHTVIRLHVAKVLPGSADWFTNHSYVDAMLADPSLGANVDVLAPASRFTHQDRKQRWQVNLAYFSILIPLRIARRCVSSTLLPQGGRGVCALLARAINPHMPYDR